MDDEDFERYDDDYRDEHEKADDAQRYRDWKSDQQRPY